MVGASQVHLLDAAAAPRNSFKISSHTFPPRPVSMNPFGSSNEEEEELVSTGRRKSVLETVSHHHQPTSKCIDDGSVTCSTDGRRMAAAVKPGRRTVATEGLERAREWVSARRVGQQRATIAPNRKKGAGSHPIFAFSVGTPAHTIVSKARGQRGHKRGNGPPPMHASAAARRHARTRVCNFK